MLVAQKKQTGYGIGGIGIASSLQDNFYRHTSFRILLISACGSGKQLCPGTWIIARLRLFPGPLAGAPEVRGPKNLLLDHSQNGDGCWPIGPVPLYRIPCIPSTYIAGGSWGMVDRPPHQKLMLSSCFWLHEILEFIQTNHSGLGR